MLYTILTLATAVFSLPNGSPSCKITDSTIQKGHTGPSDSKLGYALHVQPAGHNNWNITIRNSAGRSDVQGIFSKNPPVAAGSATASSATAAPSSTSSAAPAVGAGLYPSSSDIATETSTSTAVGSYATNTNGAESVKVAVGSSVFISTLFYLLV